MAGATLNLGVLAEVKVLGLDTAPLIYLIEQHPRFGPPVLEIARRLDAGDLVAATSTLTLTEVLSQPLRLGRHDLVHAYRRLLEGHEGLRLVSVDSQVAVLAAELRSRHSLRTPDAIQVAAALHAGCDAFLTNDGDLRRVAELEIILVSDLVTLSE